MQRESPDSVPDFGPMQRAKALVSSVIRSDAEGKALVSSGLRSDAEGKGPSQFRTSVRCRGQGPSQFRTSVRCSGQGPVCDLYVIVWYVVVWGSSLSFVLTVSVLVSGTSASKGKGSG
ncbi:unnamed protein product [Lactuca virosa]|uniref:Uncharacterized protein n=1 Tax=Lactuca virosa TaxID=75947 RepID=A0AAU9MYB8_9ASTR|nr:unnamed protein product [Lactuca virosa]